MLDRVLGGDHEEWLGQRVRMRIHSDLALVHGLEQRRLGLRSGAVDLVGQQDVGEDRSPLELKLLLDGGID